MFRAMIPAALIALVGSQAQAQYPYPAPHHHPVPVYAPPHAHHVRHAPPVYTMDEFIKCFRPTEGHHRVWIVHPRTNQPVEVCFNLPCGKLREVEVNRNSIEFDYSGARDVQIEFRRNGTVEVKN